MIKRKFLDVLIILFSIALAFFFLTNYLAQKTAKIIKNRSQNIAGLSLNIKSYEINYGLGRLTLKGIRIYEAGKRRKKNLLASVDKLVLIPSLKSILEKRIHIRKAIFIKPTIQYICGKNKKCNWDALDLSEFEDNEPRKKNKKGKDEWKIWIDSIGVKEGTIRYKDYYKGQRIELYKVSSTLKNIKSNARPRRLPTKLYLKGNLGKTKGRVKITGRTNLFGDGLNFRIKSQIINAPIRYFYSFYASEVPFKIKSGVMNIYTDAKCRKSYLKSYSTIKIRNLRVGGNPKGILADKFLTTTNRKLKLNAVVRGNLETGKIYFSSKITDQVIDNILGGIKKKSPIRKIKKKTKSIGRKIKKFFSR